MSAHDGLQPKRLPHHQCRECCCRPINRPGGDQNRNRYLETELTGLPARAVVVALGTIAHQAVLRGPSCAFADYRFRHGARHRLPNGLTLRILSLQPL